MLLCDLFLYFTIFIDRAFARLSMKKKPTKKGEDPNKSKRPPSAFFVFI